MDISQINLSLSFNLSMFVYILWITERVAFLTLSKIGHFKRKWILSSTPLLHNLHILLSILTLFYFKYMIAYSEFIKIPSLLSKCKLSLLPVCLFPPELD